MFDRWQFSGFSPVRLFSFLIVLSITPGIFVFVPDSRQIQLSSEHFQPAPSPFHSLRLLPRQLFLPSRSKLHWFTIGSVLDRFRCCCWWYMTPRSRMGLNSSAMWQKLLRCGLSFPLDFGARDIFPKLTQRKENRDIILQILNHEREREKEKEREMERQIDRQKEKER